MTLLRLTQQMSSRKALSYIGASYNMLYYKDTGRKRNAKTDDSIVGHIVRASSERPAYGTRRLAAVVARELKKPVNRKHVQRICRKTGTILPHTTKKDAIRHGSRKVQASRPYEIWEVDITYIPAGKSWAYCYTVLDVFTRQWVGYVLSTTATASAAVEALLDALHRHPDAEPSKLTIRSDHGSQYTSKEFNSSIKTLGLEHEYSAAKK